MNSSSSCCSGAAAAAGAGVDRRLGVLYGTWLDNI